MKDLALCICGFVHFVEGLLHGAKVLVCATAPPEQFTLFNDRLLPREVRVPRPETVW